MELSIGPSDIPAGTHHLWFPAYITAIPFNSWIRGFDWTVTDKNGRKIKLDILHHANIIDPNRRELFYPIARRLLAVSNDTKPGKMPSIYGVPLKANDPLLINVMYQNLQDTAINEVYLHLFLNYNTDEGLIKPKNVYPFYIDIGGVLLPRDFDVPSGFSEKVHYIRAPTNGKIIGMGGHLHNYGRKITMTDTTTKELVWETKPQINDSGVVINMPIDKFILDKKEIKVDHVYEAVATYNNPLDRSSPDTGMGTIGGAFILENTEDTAWMKIDRDNPTYLDDMVLMLGAPIVNQWHDITADEMREKLNIHRRSVSSNENHP